MADKPNDNEVISYDTDFLESFIARLTELIDGFEEPAKHVRAVGEVFHTEVSKGTNSGGDAKVFQPLGRAVDTAVGKIESNLQGLVEHLRHDRTSLQRLLDAVRGTEHEAARSISGITQPETIA